MELRFFQPVDEDNAYYMIRNDEDCRLYSFYFPANSGKFLWRGEMVFEVYIGKECQVLHALKTNKTIVLKPNKPVCEIQNDDVFPSFAVTKKSAFPLAFLPAIDSLLFVRDVAPLYFWEKQELVLLRNEDFKLRTIGIFNDLVFFPSGDNKFVEISPGMVCFTAPDFGVENGCESSQNHHESYIFILNTMDGTVVKRLALPGYVYSIKPEGNEGNAIVSLNTYNTKNAVCFQTVSSNPEIKEANSRKCLSICQEDHQRVIKLEDVYITQFRNKCDICDQVGNVVNTIEIPKGEILRMETYKDSLFICCEDCDVRQFFVLRYKKQDGSVKFESEHILNTEN